MSRRLSKPDPRTAVNRFAGGGVAVLDQDFTDREQERADLARSLRTPRGHVVVSGLRRIGKTSILTAVRNELMHAGHPVIYVDLWTASTVEDMTTRLAAAALKALGRNWTEVATELGSRLKLGFEVEETSSGMLVPVPKLEFRDAPVAIQRRRLVDALDLLEEIASKRNAHLGVIIDEFQEIERLGSEGKGRKQVSAMKQVRAAIQHHQHVTYIFAGSDRRLIAALHDTDGGALHNLARKYEIGPIETGHFAQWIEREFRAMGMDADGLARRMIEVAGPRTRDVRTLTETVAELARSKPKVTEKMIEEAVLTVVRQRRPSYETDWKPLTKLQQNVLRAVAAEGARITRASVRAQFGLGDTSPVSKTIETLATRQTLLRDGNLILFDDPFYRAWVVQAALPDVGVRLSVTHVPELAHGASEDGS